MGQGNISVAEVEPVPSVLLSLPPEVWGDITSYFGSNSKTLGAFMMASKITYNLMCRPSALKHLHIDLSSKRGKFITEWPSWFSKFPSLFSIGLSLNSDSKLAISTETLDSLPRTLGHLHLGFADAISNEMLDHLPPFLLTLNLESNTRITNDGIGRLPGNLVSLHLPENYRLTSLCLHLLPRTLLHLSIRTRDGLPEVAAKALPQLATFRIFGNLPLSGPAIAALPPSLQVFHCGIKPGIDVFNTAMLPEGLLFLESDFPDLGPSLSLPATLSSLVAFTSPPISEETIQCLPRSLTHLELRQDTSLNIECLRQSPPLQVLILPSHVSEWDKEWLDSLPNTLHTLNLAKNDKFTNQTLALLPKNLLHFSCTWNECITEGLAALVPPTLRTLELRVGLIFNCYPDRLACNHPVMSAFPTTVFYNPSLSNTKISSHSTFEVLTFALDCATMRLSKVWPSYSPSVVRDPPQPNLQTTTKNLLERLGINRFLKSFFQVLN